jgi:uncharacterized protein (DUF952 family)
MSAPNPIPSFVYKILPNTSPYTGVPIPIPSSWSFQKTQADLDDGFVHLSTQSQLPATLTRFFETDDNVQLMRLDYQRMANWKIVKWEESNHGGSFAHLYGELTGDLVDEVKVVAKEDGWDSVCRRLEEVGWLRH